MTGGRPLQGPSELLGHGTAEVEGATAETVAAAAEAEAAATAAEEAAAAAAEVAIVIIGSCNDDNDRSTIPNPNRSYSYVIFV